VDADVPTDEPPVDVDQPKDDANAVDVQQQFMDVQSKDEKPIGVVQSTDGDAASSTTSDGGESAKIVDESSQKPTEVEESTTPATVDMVYKPSTADTAETESAPEKTSEDVMDTSEPDDAKAPEANAEAAAKSEPEGKALDVPGAAVPNVSDQDSTVESDMFESRQQFVNYCQTNHCQFDELRRAKHSTMLVLFQLHNPSDPKFPMQCSACYRDMTDGFRYHCNNCENFDLCEECYEPVTTGQWAAREERFAHDSSHTFQKVDLDAPQASPTSLEERQKALKSHLRLLEHAGSCGGGCSIQDCSKMKCLFEHVKTCEMKPKSGCGTCSRLLSLCALHARNCSASDTCPVPFCERLRETNGRLRLQQQLMDDRRRQAQNELYHAGADS
jgi:E1A/CREB-binding protein